MNKTLRNFLFVIGGILVLFFIGSQTKTLAVYRVASISNYPAFDAREFIVCSNLKKPKKLDFIGYRFKDFDETIQIGTHRLIGLPGDLIEIKNSNLFVNNISIDSSLNLSKFYYVPVEDFETIENYKINQEHIVYMNNEKLLVNITSSTYKKYNLNYQPFINNEHDSLIEEAYNKKWNADNFGPYTVPEDCYFVLGDNRSNSLDSRYLGPIRKDDVVFTILF